MENVAVAMADLNVEVDTPQQTVSTSGGQNEGPSQSQQYTLELDEEQPSTLEESKNQYLPGGETEQSQGAIDEGILWPSQQPEQNSQ